MNQSDIIEIQKKVFDHLDKGNKENTIKYLKEQLIQDQEPALYLMLGKLYINSQKLDKAESALITGMNIIEKRLEEPGLPRIKRPSYNIKGQIESLLCFVSSQKNKHSITTKSILKDI